MSYPIFAPGNTWYSQGGTTVKKTTFTGITILDSYTPTGEETESWNADVDNNGDIKCYIKGTELIIAGNGSGKLALNEDSSYMFSDSNSSYTFNRVTNIDGLENLDTSNAETMKDMFYHCSYISNVNLTNFNTSKCTDLSEMFRVCNRLEKIIGIEKIDTHNVTNFYKMFGSCFAISELNLVNFNTKKGTNMEYMFNDLRKLKKITLGSDFNFSGDGSSSLKAVLPTPSSTYITGTSGKWHSEDCITYTGSTIPNETKMTYYAIPTEVPTTMTINYGTLYNIAKVIRSKTSNNILMNLVDMESEISSISSYKISHPNSSITIGDDGYITLDSGDFDDFNVEKILYIILNFNEHFCIACRENKNSDNFYCTYLNTSSLSDSSISNSLANMYPNDSKIFEWMIDPNLLNTDLTIQIKTVCTEV